MTTEYFYQLMDKIILCDAEDYIHKILKDFSRFTSNFQLLPFDYKIQSHYLTSLNIKMGYALEEVVKEYLIEQGVKFLDRRIVAGKDCDQIFTYNDKVFLIEQKVRDDHDSSKKVGQIENYLEKREYLLNNFPDIKSCCWFIDNDFHKNRAYYQSQLKKDELYYGNQIEIFFKEVFGDDRCKNFYNWLSEMCYAYRVRASFQISFNIDYKNFSVSELYSLLYDKNSRKSISKILFNDIIPYKEILDWVNHQRKSDKKEKLIKLLMEEINNE